MSTKKIMRPSADEIAMIMRRERIPATGACDTVNLTPSSMNDTSKQFLDYRLYRLNMSVVFTIKYILDMSIFVFGGNNEKNGALKVVDVAIFL